MVRKTLNKKDYGIIKNEMNYWVENNVIDHEVYESIMSIYEIKEENNFARILLTIGAILIGLGVISFIGSNWYMMSNILKFAVIILLYFFSSLASFKLNGTYEKTSRSLLYLSLLIYGAGIFLTGQMSSFGGRYDIILLAFAAGAIPYALIFKDNIIYSFAGVLLLIYTNTLFKLGSTPAVFFLIIPGLYYIRRFMDYSDIAAFVNNTITLNFILYMLSKENLGTLYSCAAFFVIGIIMYYIPIKLNRNVFKLQGNLVIGTSGIFLTFSDIWQTAIHSNHSMSMLISIIFAIIFFLYLLSLTRKGSIISLVFICITVSRFYFDAAYDFLPKSVFFIIGGLILLITGFLLEKLRKKGGLRNE